TSPPRGHVARGARAPTAGPATGLARRPTCVHPFKDSGLRPVWSEYRNRLGIVPPGASRSAASQGYRARFSRLGRWWTERPVPYRGGSSAKQPRPDCFVVRSRRRLLSRGRTSHPGSRPAASLERQTSRQARTQGLREEACACAPSSSLRGAGIRAPVLLAKEAELLAGKHLAAEHLRLGRRRPDAQHVDGQVGRYHSDALLLSMAARRQQSAWVDGLNLRAHRI